MEEQLRLLQQIRAVCVAFQLPGLYKRHDTINSGHINSTYRVFFENKGREESYLLQRVNTNVFKNPYDVMENIASVTEYVRSKLHEQGVSSERRALHYYTTKDGTYYVTFSDKGFWRCCSYIDDSISPTDTDDLKLIEETGKAFGEFQVLLDDYPVKNLHITIEHFHNTIRRFDALNTALADNKMGRKKEVGDIVAQYRELEARAIYPYQLQKKGVLHLRVTHNDTKTSNVLFDAKTRERLAVIDLDTVMPGLIAFDFGDGVRIAASTAKEDEQYLEKVKLDMQKYEAFTRGFVREVKGMLTPAEKETLALGAISMTVEVGVRFLTDYLEGDEYFRIHYADQNLVRAKCQLALAQDMVKKLDQMQRIVNKYCEE